MKRYLVRFPIVGEASVVVEAESEDQAIEKADNEISSDDIDEWKPVRHVVQGNVCYADFRDVVVTEE